MRHFALALFLAGLWGCASGSPYVMPSPAPVDGSQPVQGAGLPAAGVTPVGSAGAAVAEGVVAAGVSKANNGCVATCVNGMVCNSKTGLCDNLPCGGTCQSWEVCKQDDPNVAPRCEAAVVPNQKP